MEIAHLAQTCQGQHGVINRSQALEIMSPGQFNYLVAKGVLVWAWPSTYVLAGAPDTWERRASAALLSIAGAALSHTSAARVWGLTYAQSDDVEITVPPAKAKVRPGIVVHRSEQLGGLTLVQSGFRCTSVARTLVDLSGTVSPKQLGAYVNQALRLRLVRLAEISACLEEMVTKGRSRITDMREILAERNLNDELVETEFERKVLNWIRTAGMSEPIAQRWYQANGSWYRPDLAYPDLRIAIEPDGPHHLAPDVAAHDRKRDFDFETVGWVVVHIDLAMDRWEALRRIRLAVQSRQQSHVNTDYS